MPTMPAARRRCPVTLHTGALLLAFVLALPLAGCRAPGDGSPAGPSLSGPPPTPIDLEAIPYTTRLGQDIDALEGACASLAEALAALEADPARLDDPLWAIELEAAATEAWAATLVILARENVPSELTEQHARLMEPANVVNLAAEGIVYPEDGATQRSPTTLLALRPAFTEACPALVETARPMLEDAGANSGG
jgi:hypothetical protein